MMLSSGPGGWKDPSPRPAPASRFSKALILKFGPASRWPFWGRRAWARARCCTCLADWTGPPRAAWKWPARTRSEEHTSELQSRGHLVCRLLLEKKKGTQDDTT